MLLPVRQEVLKESQRHHVMIDVNQSGDAEKDVECLRRIVDILRCYPGQDRVSLIVLGDGEMTNLEMPNTMVNYCPELAGELAEIVGQGNLRLEP
jgi:hypothetical protein